MYKEAGSRFLFASLFSVTLLSFAACGGDSSTDNGNPMNGGNPEADATLQGITAAHNSARSSVVPAAATPIPALTWSESLAATAQTWANKCNFAHSGNQYGENIFGTSGTAKPQDVVDDWVSEKANYDYASNTCSGVCGHYTQVVWSKSTSLGCGVATCPPGGFFTTSWQFWVCNYDPPGNFNGQRPY